MKRKKLLQKTLLIAFFLLSASTYAEQQHYDMTFAGRGETTTVETVVVENITQNTSLNLNGTDILRLTSQPTGIEETAANGAALTEPILYPNPAQDRGTLIFDAATSGQVLVSIADLSGRMLNNASFNLEAGRYSISLPAMPTGMFMVSIRGAGTDHSFKWMCTGNGPGTGMIALNGADGTLLPIVQTRAVQSNAKVVEMLYNEGDLLRFTGTNGNMTTIVTNIPTCSHDITFDFYNCTDATGRHYPIVRAGDLLWMAEDLGYSDPKNEIFLADNASRWKSLGATTPQAAYYEYSKDNALQGAYYNYIAAQSALPEGWALPTSGEVDYMVKALGGYETAAARMMCRDAGTLWSPAPTDADTLSFAAQPYGTVAPEGTFTDYAVSANYLTRSTISGRPVSFSLQSNGELKMDPQTAIADAGQGFHVRGCRQAPSAYNDMIKLFGAPETQNLRSTASLPATRTGLFESGPLGGQYTLAVEYKKLFSNLGSTTHTLYRDYQKGAYTPLSVDATDYSRYIRKAAAQKNGNGYENHVMAYFNRSISVLAATTEYGTAYEGNVTLVVTADSTRGYARQTVTLPGTFTMPAIENNFAVNEGTGALTMIRHYHSQMMFRMEEFSKQFNIACADFTGDGVDEIVVVLGSRVAVYDGTDYHLISEKTMIENPSFRYTCTRIAVGDVDGDGTPDLAVLWSNTAPVVNPLTQFTQMSTIYLYRSGDLTSTDIPQSQFTAVSANNTSGQLTDIKIGRVTGSNQNDIVCFNRNISLEYGAISLLQYDQKQNQLQTILRKIDYFGFNGNTYPLGINTLALVHSRGAIETADIVCMNSINRYDPEGKNLVEIGTIWEHNSNDKTNSSSAWRNIVFSDNIVAGNFNNDPNGHEQVMAVTMSLDIPENQGAPVCYYHTQVLTEAGTGKFAFKDLTNSEPIVKAWDPGLKFEYKQDPTGLSKESYFYTSERNKEVYAYANLAAVRSAGPIKIMKYAGWQAVMSEPRIYALLAAPPYYKNKKDGTPYDYAYSFGTSWGKSSLSGSATENASSNRAIAIVGYEQDFTIPIVAKKVGGIDFETKLEMEWTNSAERQETITKTNEFTAVDNDAVVLSAYFYDMYTYEITQSGNPDEVGSKLIISLPSQPRTLMITLPDYERASANAAGIPNLRKLFRHTVGDPFSYPSEKSDIRTNVPNTPIYWGGNVGGDEFIGTGSGGTLNRKVELDSQTAKASGFTFDMSAELVATAMGVKVGAGYGYNNSNNTTHTEGEGHSISGNVAGLRQIGEAGLADFRWNVCWYQYEVDGQRFPVVYYVVKK